MSKQSNEANITLAIEAIRKDPKMSIRRAAVTYQVPRSTLQARLLGRAPTYETRNPAHILTSSEEETLVQHILDLDSRGFPPRFDYVRDMANLLLATRHTPPVGKQ